MSTIAIIPARGGSKRIDRKNIKDFRGKPIICYSIAAALESGIFDDVTVSTDDPEIAEIAAAAGASVPFLRSSETADDHATILNVLLEVLARYEEAGCTFERLCLLYPAAPFVRPADLRDSHELFANSDADSLLTVVKYSHPPQRGLILDDGFLAYKYPEYMNTRSQDLEPLYFDAGQYCFTGTERLRQENSLLGKRVIPAVVPELRAQDIDTIEDWIIAERKYAE